MKNISIEKVYLLFFLFLAVLGLYRISNGLGYANNGDFERSMYPAGLDLTDHVYDTQYYRNHLDFYKMNSNKSFLIADGYSLNDEFVRLSTKIQQIINPQSVQSEVFSVNILGITYFLILFLGLFLLSKNHEYKWLCLLYLWILCDPFYFLFLNSFYSESIALIGIIFSSIVLLNTAQIKKFNLSFLSSLVSAVFITAAKLQMVFSGLILYTAFFIPLFKKKKVSKKVLNLSLLVVIITLSLSIFYVFNKDYHAHGSIKEVNYVHTLNAVLKVSSNPEVFSKKFSVTQNDLSPNFLASFRMNVVKDVFADPIAVKKILQEAYWDFKKPSLAYIGQFHEKYQAPLSQLCTRLDFCSYRNLMTDKNCFWFLYILIALGGACFFVFKLDHPLFSIQLFLLTFLLSQIFICFMGDGFHEFQKHLVPARFALDVLFITNATWLAQNIATKILKQIQKIIKNYNFNFLNIFSDTMHNTK